MYPDTYKLPCTKGEDEKGEDEKAEDEKAEVGKDAVVGVQEEWGALGALLLRQLLQQSGVAAAEAQS